MTDLRDAFASMMLEEPAPTIDPYALIATGGARRRTRRQIWTTAVLVVVLLAGGTWLLRGRPSSAKVEPAAANGPTYLGPATQNEKGLMPYGPPPAGAVPVLTWQQAITKACQSAGCPKGTEITVTLVEFRPYLNVPTSYFAYAIAAQGDGACFASSGPVGLSQAPPAPSVKSWVCRLITMIDARTGEYLGAGSGGVSTADGTPLG